MNVNTRHARIKSAMRRHLHGMVPFASALTERDELMDLWLTATKLGLFQAADWLWKNAELEDDV